MEFDRRKFIQGALVALSLTTPVAKLLALAEAPGPLPDNLEFIEEISQWRTEYRVTAKCRKTGVMAPPFRCHHKLGVPMSFEERQFAKRMIVQWFEEGGADRTLKNCVLPVSGNG